MTMSRNVVAYVVLAAILAAGLAVLFFAGPRWLTAEPEQAPVAAEPPTEVRKIRARLFYVAEDGRSLSSVEREVVYGEGPIEQAKQIVEAQLAPPDDPLVSAIPPGTRLRTIFLADGDAFIDLTPEMRANHPGGTTNEILTVYTLVNVLTTNLPAITGVQILVNGREVDTLVGHLDLRRPIEPDLRWISE